MTEKKDGRGGARVGAGRKQVVDKVHTPTRSFRLSDQEYEKFQELGGVVFLRSLLKMPAGKLIEFSKDFQTFN